MERFYPLHARVCEECLLVQLEDFVSPAEIFPEYAYFSSYSDTWVEHARTYADAMIDRLGLAADSSVVEVASNDGYLLRHFAARGIPVLGIEPAGNVAAAAREVGVQTLVAFFGREIAGELVGGRPLRSRCREQRSRAGPGPERLRRRPRRAARAERRPHNRAPASSPADRGAPVRHDLPRALLLLLVHDRAQGARRARPRRVRRRGAADARRLAPHPCPAADAPPRPESDRVDELAAREDELGYTAVEAYTSFQAEVEETKRALLAFLIGAKRDGLTVVGYGAPGKGNTLLNYCGIRTDFLEYTVDRNPYKQGRYLPGPGSRSSTPIGSPRPGPT